MAPLLGVGSISNPRFFFPEDSKISFKIDSAKKILKDFIDCCNFLSEEKTYLPSKESRDPHLFFNSNILSLIHASDNHEDTLGHSQSVASYTLLLTEALGIEDEEFLTDIVRGALLHDIGKIAVSKSILRKVGPLTAMEKEIIKDHPILGYVILEGFDFLRKAAQVVLFHHEHYDGRGYPYGLAAEEIPLEARIFSLADTLDAYTSDRAYRKGKTFDEAVREINKCRGSQFDPLIVDVFFSIPKEKWSQTKQEAQNLIPLPIVN